MKKSRHLKINFMVVVRFIFCLQELPNRKLTMLFELRLAIQPQRQLVLISLKNFIVDKPVSPLLNGSYFTVNWLT